MSQTDSSAQDRTPRIPGSTYRIQFNAGFTFRDATEIIPYLAELGVSDLYASPYLQARPGSMHGYDIVDHTTLNREIGNEHDLARMSAALKSHDMGHLLDIVPNHMGVAMGARGHRNPWWMSVLENGESSPYARFFDIDWNPRNPALRGRVLLPVLGDQYGCVLENGDLRLVYEEGQFRVEYYETWFPVAPGSTAAVLELAHQKLRLDEDDADRMELESIVTALRNLPSRTRTDEASINERMRERKVSRRRLDALVQGSSAVRAALDAAITEYNGTPGQQHTFDRLDVLIRDQSYRLAYWRVAAEEINYRRFFDINDLAGLRTEIPRVFNATHELILRLVREGVVTGLRIDHPDGLFDPAGYFRDLQRHVVGLDARDRFYVLIEKILTGDEPLPESWPVAGTVGYEFMNRVNGVFVASGREAAMDAVYRAFTGQNTPFEDLVYEKKRLILRTSLVSELTVLTTLLDRMSERNRCFRDFTWGSLRDALREVVACFPVYRTYIDAFSGAVTERDRKVVEQAVAAAEERNRTMPHSLFDFLRDTLLLKWPDSLNEKARRQHARFVMKFQQLTGPVMAKGVEDTAFYVFNRLISLNEVGGEPDRYGVSADEFHAFNLERAERWPHTMSASSTHDTKRSEDVRARINVLSEIPELWGEHLERWRGFNAGFKRGAEGRPIPDANDEYLLYQTIVGAWPFGTVDDQQRQDLVARVQAYMEKATREAKTHTSWINPNQAYDQGIRDFVADILRPGEDNAFVADLVKLQPVVERLGMVNALAQTLIKLVSPGVPDVYQGQEIWDFSLVDPDNRRPVDFGLRRELLARLKAAQEEGDGADMAADLMENWRDGRIKMHLTQRALLLRAALPGVFGGGDYVPLTPDGTRAEHVIAFARTGDGASVIAVAPRLPATLTAERDYDVPRADDYAGTRVPLPAHLAGRYRDVLTGMEIAGEMRDGALTLPVPALFAHLPIALLERIG
ncbi:malto-oligosyltrehalose synthase [Longimicrobium terrae]|uniref:(1->4)-alpha-D-glucan 1-alpha-D-glucosylmutase n=1 Tax=Longimicrobium terrae TaxID=1639882 RepID=A0A841GYT4_9BACT|nr:(1->4)-alpha-D-glucan 1-alpha-D-glucosylmutase [Longimicrobium terrae]MBB6070913.1 (1->4)-alpha-D-glucan 1-alpha-D-glucosylmutase [Longimicrobium terrae]NNC28936.1 malto-oligosyltrehalose synthase [Longimicrobium terrae]